VHRLRASKIELFEDPVETQRGPHQDNREIADNLEHRLDDGLFLIHDQRMETGRTETTLEVLFFDQ
jgi:hypothetical protein